MKKYKVVIGEPAMRDMEEIYNYIAFTLQAPENAIRQYNRIAEAVLSLEEMPDRIRIPDSGICRELGLRALLVDHYVIFYYIDADTVTVTDVLYGASDIPNRLKGLQ